MLTLTDPETCSRSETSPFSPWTIRKAPTSSPPSGSFSEALFWGSIQQELYLAVMYQTPIELDLGRLNLDFRMKPDDDKSWTKIILFHLLETVQYCFGNDQNSEKYDALLRKVSVWAETRPASFDPVYTCPPKAGSMLPELWFLNASIAAGIQYYHLIRVLLTSHHPRIPRLGNALKTATQWIDVRTSNAAYCSAY